MRKAFLLVLLGIYSLCQGAGHTLTFSNTNASCFGSCNGSSTVIISGGTGPFGIFWSPGGQSTSTISGICAGTYYCIVTDSSDMTTASGTISIFEPAALNSNAGPDCSVCLGTSIQINGSFTGGAGSATYSWSPSTGLSSTNIPNPYTSPFSTTTYTFIVTDANGCTSSDEVIVNVNPLPMVSAGSDISLCYGDSIQINASGAVSYSWNPTSSLLTTMGPTVTAWPTTTTTYTVTGQDGNACESIDEIAIYVYPLPSLTVSSSSALICSDGRDTLRALSNGATIFSWSPGAGLTLLNDSTVIASPSSTTVYSATAVDSYGCISTASASVNVDHFCVFPGDANDDLVVNSDDFLALGTGFGSTGPSRINPVTSWTGQIASSWGDSLTNGTDYKHIDSNGDGVIDYNDSTAIALNYSMSHARESDHNNSGPEIRMEFNSDTVADGSTVTGTLYFGDSINPANDVYGLAFSVEFDPTLIDSGSFRFYPVPGWFGTPGSNLISMTHPSNSNTIDFVVTRINHSNVSGYGLLGSFSFNTKGTLNNSGNTQEIPLDIVYSKCVKADETPVPVSGNSNTITISDANLLVSANEIAFGEIEVSVYPNPFQNQFSVIVGGKPGEEFSFNLFDIAGKLIMTSKGVSGKPMLVSSQDLQSGIYFANIRSGNAGIKVVKVFAK